MKQNESLVLQPEIKYILKPQVSVNVVLNGGEYELDDATIPFQIGFSGNTAYKRPTHVLVIDVTQNAFQNDGARKHSDTVSERTLLKLEPVNYLQLKKSGKHHLIFILFSGFPKWQYETFFSKRFTYENGLEFDRIEKKQFTYQVGYCEKVITVPEEFFAKKSETKLSKAIWYWVNSWHKLQPIDECEYRKRKISAFTIKPIIWLLGFMARFLIASLVTLLQFCVRVIALIFGYQPVRFFPHFKEVWWHFLFRYSQSMLKMDEIFDFADYWIGTTFEEKYFDGADEEDFHKYKFHSILGKSFHSPLTIFGLIFYTVAAIAYTVLIFSMFSFQANNFVESLGAFVFTVIILLLASAMLAYNTLPTLFGDKHWKLKWDKSDINYKHCHAEAYRKSVGILLGLSFLAFIISAVGRWMISRPAQVMDWTPPSFKETLLTILWALGMGLLTLLGAYLIKYFISFVQKTRNKIKLAANETKKTEEAKHIQWLRSSFSLKNLPEKVDVTKAPEPSALVHRFVIKFWQTKAKVCRPYAKD